MLWNTLNDDANMIESVAAFKREIKVGVVGADGLRFLAVSGTV